MKICTNVRTVFSFSEFIELGHPYGLLKKTASIFINPLFEMQPTRLNEFQPVASAKCLQFHEQPFHP